MRRVEIFLLAALLSCVGAAAHNDKYVNMFLGSKGDHGQTTPAASVPFGMIAVCPDSDPFQHGGYDYEVPNISGISINRISGVGCGGAGCNLSIFPGLRNTKVGIVKGTEKAFPGYYETLFDNGVKASLTATRDAALELYEFPDNGGSLSVDFIAAVEKRKTACSFDIIDDHTIKGWVQAGTTCAFGTYKFYFTLSTSAPFKVLESSGTEASLLFGSRKVEVRIGINAVAPECADMALEAIAGRSFASVKASARRLWRERLDKIKVTGGDKEQKVLFYTSMYRVMLSPVDVTSRDGRYRGTDGNIYTLPEGRRHFASWSMWDTFRTKFPMLVILVPDLFEDIAASAVDLFVTGKKNWATEFESVPTVRTEHTQIMLLDAYRKGIKGIDLAKAFPGMLAEAATELPRTSLDNRLETAYDLWALGQIAAIIGENEKADTLSAEALAMFTEVWKPNFMNPDSTYSKMRQNGLYQGTKWQYRWAAPQYVSNMVEWKGEDTLAAELSEFFDRKLFNQGNEPDIHTPFMFNLFGRHDLTSSTVAALLTDDKMVHIYGGNAEYPEPYVGRAFRNAPDGYAPEMDEDDGAMSSWYMFAQMGFYPVVVGENRYEVFSPLFDRIVLRTGARKTVIKTHGRKAYNDGNVEKRLTVNGMPQDDFVLSNDVFLNGGSVIIEY